MVRVCVHDVHRLPDLKTSISESHRRIEEEISSLPPPPADDALFQLITILGNYKKHLESAREGNQISDLWPALHQRFREFKDHTRSGLTRFYKTNAYEPAIYGSPVHPSSHPEDLIDDFKHQTLSK